MIYAEEVHAGEVDKMSQKRGEVAVFFGFTGSANHNQAGDPVELAARVVEIAAMATPPSRDRSALLGRARPPATADERQVRPPGLVRRAGLGPRWVRRGRIETPGTLSPRAWAELVPNTRATPALFGVHAPCAPLSRRVCFGIFAKNIGPKASPLPMLLDIGVACRKFQLNFKESSPISETERVTDPAEPF